MEEISENGLLTIPLYHGTSTLFIDSIFQHGLGGKNPIQDWKILDLAREVLVLSEKHLMDFETFTVRQMAFKNMVDQKITAGGFNFQHGDTYLSPAKKTAIKYAADKRLGSELVTYTIDLLQELERRNVAGVRTDLYRRFRDGFNLLDICPAPLLIEARGIPVGALLDEEGNEATANLESIVQNRRKNPEIADELNQQTNFRLTQTLPKDSLRFWMINVTSYNGGWTMPDYSLYSLTQQDSESSAK